MKPTGKKINKKTVVKDVQNILIVQSKEVFSFSDHLTVSKLFYNSN